MIIVNHKDEILKFYNNPKLDVLLGKMCHNDRYRDDLKQDLIIHLYSLKDSRIKELINKKELFFYTYGYLKNQYHSSKSKFYKTYRNFTNLKEGFDIEYQAIDLSDQELIIKVDNILDTKINWFDAFLFKKYYYEWWDDSKNKMRRGLSYRKIERGYSLSSDFKIDHMYVYNSVKVTLEKIRNELGI